MGFINFYHFLPILDPFLAFGYILGQFPIYCHMCIYKLCNHVKNALINGISMDIFNFYHFLTYFGPFYPFLAFCYILGQFSIYCHMCIYKLCNHAKNCTHKWYFSGHFYFYFLPFFYLFWTLFYHFLAFCYILGQFSIDCHMRIYKLCNHDKNCTHKWYYYGHFEFLNFYNFFTYFGPFFTLF